MTHADVEAEFKWRTSITNSDRNQDVGRLLCIWHLLSGVISYEVPGDVVEIGCYVGQTSVFMQKTMRSLGSTKSLHLYDAFQGLQELGEHDAGTTRPDVIHKGAVKCDITDVLETFDSRQCPLPQIHVGWLNQTLPMRLPDTIAFALFDTDLYEPIKLSLEAVWPRMAKGGIIAIDDYGWDGTPGCTKAVDEFFADKQQKPYTQFGLVQCFIRK